MILVGGWTGQKYATAVLRYTPGGRAGLVARLPEGVRSPAVAVIGDTLVVAGGLTEQGASRQVYAIDLASGGVKALAALPEGLDRAALLVVGFEAVPLRRPRRRGQAAGHDRPDRSGSRVGDGGGQHAASARRRRRAHSGAQALLVDTRGGVVYRVG